MKYELPKYKIDYEKDKIDVKPFLSTGMRKVLEWQNENAKDAFNTDCSWQELRLNYIDERKFWNEGGPVPYKIKEYKIDGPVGEIPLRIYYPNDNPKNYACIFIHGGGYTVGNNDTHDRMMRTIMEYGECAVIGIDYTLAPEEKFPVQLLECVEVIREINSNPEKYGVWGDNLAIAGDSAGGNMAVAASLYIRDVYGSNDYISSLLLFYPFLGVFDSPSTRLLGNDLDGMKMADLLFYQSCYIDDSYDINNPYYSVINADLSYDIPSTFISCGDLDPLLDCNVLFSKILKNNGIGVELDVVPGVLHAFAHYGKFMEESIESIKKSGDFYKKTRLKK